MSFPMTHDESRQEFTTVVEGARCLLQYRLSGTVMTIVHTEVPPELEGHGIAGDLMRAALETARRNGWRVLPACSYARWFLRRHREYDDLIAQGTQGKV